MVAPSSTRFSPSVIMKEYIIITLKYRGKKCWLYLLCFVENNILIFEPFRNLTMCIFNKKHVKLMGFICAQCILGNFQYGGDHNRCGIFAFFFKFFEGIWNNHIDIQQKNMQVRFIMFLCTRGYNFLGNPARSLKEKHVLKYKLILPCRPYPPTPISWFANSLKEYEIITLVSNRKSIQVRFIMISCARVYNILSNLSLHYMSKFKVTNQSE